MVRTLTNAIATRRIAHAFILTQGRGPGKTTTALIFATTEIHRVPIGGLSRAQGFSLRRARVELLVEHYARIAAEEGVTAEPAAIALIARAADGSVRDGLSLLDQAIALGGGAIGESAVREMLGVADRGLVFDVLEAVLKGDAPDALRRMAALYEGGADPVMVLQDLLEFVHFLTRLKIVPSAGEEDPALEGDRARGLDLAQKLGTPVLARAWQMLLKGIAEAQTAPSPLQAAEMVLVRLAQVADTPAPARPLRQPSRVRHSPRACGSAPRVATSSSAPPAPVAGTNGGPPLGPPPACGSHPPPRPPSPDGR